MTNGDGRWLGIVAKNLQAHPHLRRRLQADGKCLLQILGSRDILPWPTLLRRNGTWVGVSRNVTRYRYLYFNRSPEALAPVLPCGSEAAAFAYDIVTDQRKW